MRIALSSLVFVRLEAIEIYGSYLTNLLDFKVYCCIMMTLRWVICILLIHNGCAICWLMLSLSAALILLSKMVSWPVVISLYSSACFSLHIKGVFW